MKSIIFIITSAIITCIIIVTFLALPWGGSHKLLVVLSGSMEPAVSAGSLLFVKPDTTPYAIGEIISFNLPKIKQFVTHRIVSLSEQDGTWMYQTKGDANNENDGFIVSENQVLGKVSVSLPYVGRLVGFAKTKQGIAVLILIPSLIVLLSELNFIFSKVRFRTGSFFLAGLIFGAATMVGTTHAFYNDTAVSSDNIFQANVSFGSPIANHLVLNEVLYDTSSTQNISGQGDSNRGEWIEIYNPTNSSQSLTNWVLEDNTSSETLSGLLGAGEYLIITGATQSEFEAIWTVSIGTTFFQASGGVIGNGFANDGDRAKLKNELGTIIDQISWGNDTTILNPSPPDVATGHSLERDPDGVDSDAAADFIDRNPPTPGS